MSSGELEKLSVMLEWLHDATFIGISMDWEKASLVLCFKLYDYVTKHSKSVEILAEGLHAIKLDKKDEWGESCFVNQANLLALEGSHTLKVEIQSGDVISIGATKFTYSETIELHGI